MYICSTEEVVTDKGCGHRLPPWLVFSWTPFCLLASTRRPSSRPARSLQRPTSACFAAQLPLPHACMCSTGLLQRLGAHGLPSPVTVMTSSALACCLRKRWTPRLDPALARANLRPREQRSGVLLPPRHVSSGCYQASPLYSPYPALCLCACSVAVTSLAVSRLQVAFWVTRHTRLEREVLCWSRSTASRAGLLPPPQADPRAVLWH